MNSVFISPSNLLNVVKQASLTGIIAVGATFVILSADIDLSVGSMAALSGVIAAGLSAKGHSVFFSISIPLLICIVIGISMGLIITKAKVHSFVVTLGMLSIARGIALVYSNGYPISCSSSSLCFLGGGRVAGIPMPVIILLIVFVIGYFVLNKTPYGRYVYAIGGNKEATRLSGINTDFYRIVSFALSALLAGLAGIVLIGRVASGQPTAAVGWELNAIAAVVIGGTSMYGGRGSMFGTLIGTLFLTVITNGLDLVGVTPFYQQIVMGGLIITAVVLDSIKKDS